MIEKLGIRGFKRFTSAELSFRPLTVLTGLNGTGKSTAIQALLLARQVAADPLAKVVQLNGPYGLALGEAFDVLHPQAVDIEITIGEDSASYDYLFTVPIDRALNLDVTRRPPSAPPALAGRGMAFSYLNAERLGPRDQLAVTAEDADLVGIGVHGEYTAQALALRETTRVPESLRHPRTRERGVITVRTQVESWASEIIRPVQITAQ